MMSREGSSRRRSNKTPIIAGAVAGVISRFVIAPLDVVKIRLQLQPQLLPQNVSALANGGGGGGGGAALGTVYKGIYGTMKTIVQEEGITALWKGNIPAELLYLTYGATQFFTYTQCKSILSSNQYSSTLPTGIINSLSGGFAGGVATSITYPFDLLRTRFAASKARGRDGRVYKSLAAAIGGIYRIEGVRGFYRGGFAAVVQIVPYMGLFFGSYEGIRATLSKIPAPDIDFVDEQYRSLVENVVGRGSVDAVSGTLAGILAKTGVFPLDTIRKRLQVQGPTRGQYVHGDIPVYEGVVKCGKEILRREGWRGLYRGLTVSLIKAAPASAVTMWTYGRVVEAVGWIDGQDK
ncbi:mitochondrial thiamine pyrophosphate transporter [Orbilia ellipsospora]|uniref:Mitochondrial thiamine pyrophosphate carrier 1 n=1 Tax=Orbilia ellipsospora TaxID=2528407 RepID=A0AAV9XH06_9PEZI